MRQIKQYREEFDNEWKEIYQVFVDNKYDHVLQGVTDCINHHNVDSSYELIHSDWPPLILKEREARFKYIWKSNAEKKEAKATSRLAEALMSLKTTEESKNEGVI